MDASPLCRDFMTASKHPLWDIPNKSTCPRWVILEGKKSYFWITLSSREDVQLGGQLDTRSWTVGITVWRIHRNVTS
jgi:hypothetical protein